MYQKIWKPFIGQVIKFAQEEKNSYDRFAISGSAKTPGKIGRAEVRHILWELNRYIWDTLDSGVIIWRKVLSDKYKPSPLFQGGLEIPIKVYVGWSNEKSMAILKEKVKSINYPCNMDYVDNSKKILKDLLGESMEEDEEEAEVCVTSECDRDQRASSEVII